jgi:integrase
VAEWSCSGLQSRLRRFDSDPSLQYAVSGCLPETFCVLKTQTKSLAPETISILSARLDSGLYPYIGSRPISAIALITTLRRTSRERSRRSSPKNFASVTDPARVGELMRAIHGYSGHPVTALALKLAPLVFVRPGELRAAEWSEFDLENPEWPIPGERMKMGEPHLVPLSRQALERASAARQGRAVPVSVASHAGSSDVRPP